MKHVCHHKPQILAEISLAICTALIFSVAYAADHGGPSVSQNEALQRLKDGNQRFVSGERSYPHLDAKRLAEITGGQHPYVTLITCSDSRVAPEHIFDVGLGDMFTIRVAGNVCDDDEVGSIEYGIDHLGTPLFVVLGHSNCGAVTAVVTEADVHGKIPVLIDNIKPAADWIKREYPNAETTELVEKAVKANVWQAIADLLGSSEAARNRVKDGSLLIVGAVYHLDTGSVEWLGPHPRESDLLLAPPVKNVCGGCPKISLACGSGQCSAVNSEQHENTERH